MIDVQRVVEEGSLSTRFNLVNVGERSKVVVAGVEAPDDGLDELDWEE